MIEFPSSSTILWTIAFLAVTAFGDHHSRDFHFENDKVVLFSEAYNPQDKSFSSSSISCPYSEGKLVLALLLKDKNWEVILPRKRDRAISKLTKFFSIVKEDLMLDDVTKHELHEMNKKSLHHGKNQINLSKKIGRLEFVIGCGKQYSTAGRLIANQIGHQIKEKSIDDISGLEFGWWVIYTKNVNNKTPRSRRQASEDGSGADEEDEYFEDYEEPITETPVQSTTHAHRHQHGLSYKQNGEDTVRMTTTSYTTTTTEKNVIPVVVIGPETTDNPPYRNEVVEKEFTELQETIQKTIENNEKVEAIEAGLEPGETLKKDDFDDVFDKSPIEPIVKTILENGDREGDYIVEDIPSIHLHTNTILPSTSNANSKKVPETTPPIAMTTTTITTTQHATEAGSESPSSTYNTIKTSPSVTWTSPGTTTTNQKQVVFMSETDSTTDNEFKENDDEDYDASTDNVESEFDTEQKLPDTGGASSSSSSSTVVTSTKQEQPNQHQQEHHEYEQLPSSSSTTTATTSTTTTTTNQEIINNNELLSTVMPLITTDSDVSMIPTTCSSSSSSLPAAAVTFSSISSIAFNNNGDDDYDETHVVSSESETAGSSSFTSPHEAVTIFTTFTTTTTTTTTITNTQATTSSSTSDNADSVESQTIVEDQNESTSRVTSTPTPEEDNYDDEYDDNYDEANAKPKSSSTTSTPEFSEEDVIPNNPPRISNRLPKIPVTAGKPFKILVPENTFADAEDENRLTLELLDSHNNPLKSNSWIQFNAVRGEIYGLPLDEATSKYQYHLRATDSGNESVIETIDIHVQQHKGHRTVNHEIEFNVRLNEKFERNIDWQLKLIDAIRTVLATSVSDIVVREVRQHTGDIHAYSFVYTNDSLPGEHCPEEELEELSERIYIEDLNRTLGPGIIVKSVVPRLVGNCKKVIPKPKSTMVASKNYPPLPRNQVDRVNATVGQLLVFRVPADTFYDPEDETDLKLSLLEMNRTKIEPQNWLQFDSKNREFYGLPKLSDVGQKDYMLVAEDREGLSTADALLVVVSASAKRDYSVMFDFNLGIPYESFNSSSKQRRFIENVAKIFQDNDLSHILVRQIRRQGHNVTVSWHNTTLHRHHHRCPSQEINRLREILMHPDSNVRDRVKETLGDEFNLVSVNIVNVGACHGADTLNHEPPMKPDEPLPRDTDDYLLTFVLPAVIILAMLLLASIVACVLHRRRLTGKMELGDEEERKSFRNKGIPVIFQDELDEKPDIASKSPIILKEEKPALLPPTYNGINPEGENDDLDEYVPPPGVGPINNRETRGKSPVTPSYRRPPPYVSP